MGWTPPALHGIDVPDWKRKPPAKRKEESEMNVTQIGVDLAKQVFQVHGCSVA